MMSALAVLVLVAGVVSGCGGAAPDSPSSISAQVLSVPEVDANRNAYVGKQVSIRGRIVIEEQQSLGPCNVTTGVGCNQVVKVTLRLVNPDDPQGDANQLDLYQSAPGGTFQPAECAIRGPGNYDCGIYRPNSIMVVQGTFTKYQQPVQQVINPDGTVVVVKSQDLFVLVVG